MPKNVHLVKMPIFDNNDEGFYEADGSETVAVCKTKDDAIRWLAEHGWNLIDGIVQDLNVNDGDNDAECPDCGGDGYTVDSEGDDLDCETCNGDGFVDRDYGTEDQRADAIQRFFDIVETTVIRYG